ncbi:hypothetical protein BC940DRAFT_307258 [Gongronella butleri]|nr:hypothetical protein BC940DRAFT_307258 [Gongronella butleri]
MRVTVFGASRGCTRAMVIQGLEAPSPHEYTLLVRNPDAIEYTAEQKAKLTLIKGSGDDKEAVKRAVEGADVVVFGIGSGVTSTLKMTDPGVCSRCTRVLLDVVASLENKPKRMIFITTTGAADKDEVPTLFKPFYHWVLAAPHDDKREMEDLITSKSTTDYIIVRPSLLTNGELTKKYRAANERLIGYTISRNDIGHFMLTQCLDDDKWLNKYVVVTY